MTAGDPAGPPEAQPRLPRVDVADIEAVISTWTGVDVQRLGQDEQSRLLQLASVLEVCESDVIHLIIIYLIDSQGMLHEVHISWAEWLIYPSAADLLLTGNARWRNAANTLLTVMP